MTYFIYWKEIILLLIGRQGKNLKIPLRKRERREKADDLKNNEPTIIQTPRLIERGRSGSPLNKKARKEGPLVGEGLGRFGRRRATGKAMRTHGSPRMLWGKNASITPGPVPSTWRKGKVHSSFGPRRKRKKEAAEKKNYRRIRCKILTSLHPKVPPWSFSQKDITGILQGPGGGEEACLLS